MSNYGNLKCLVADDFEMIRTMIKNSLNSASLTNVVEASDGEAALHALIKAADEGKPFSVIFSDWNMPKMNGIELLQACRKDERFKSIPFVMVTSEGEKTAILEAIKSGANDYIVKPFAPETVRKKLEKLFPQGMG